MQIPSSFDGFFVRENIGFDTMTYWIGIADKEHLHMAWKPGIADSICRSMDRQFDQEKNAVELGGLFMARRPWQKYFQPVAPVQFCKEWSPLEAVMTLLGDPDGHDVATDDFLGTRSFVGLWECGNGLKGQPEQVIWPERDGPWFKKLFDAAFMRAGKNHFLMVCAKPGGDYSRIPKPGPQVVEMMEIANFVVADHRSRAILRP